MMCWINFYVILVRVEICDELVYNFGKWYFLFWVDILLDCCVYVWIFLFDCLWLGYYIFDESLV